MAVQAVVIVVYDVPMNSSIGMYVRDDVADVALMSVAVMIVAVLASGSLASSNERALYRKGQSRRHGNHHSEPTQKNVRKSANASSPGQHCSSVREVYIT
jgi:hypothetical protein